MPLDLSALSAYTNQNNTDLITRSLFTGKTASLPGVKIQTGIKSSETIGFLSTDATFQAGGTCGFTSSGTTAISQRTITVGKIKINESLCPKSLEAYYTQQMLKPGSRYENIPFEQTYSQLKAGIVAEQLEKALWQGDTSSSDANLKRFDGLIKIIDAASGVVSATSQASITSATVRGIFEDIYTKIPITILDKDDLRVFCGWDTFRTLIVKLTTDNLYHYTTDANAIAGEIDYPGLSLKVVALHGLTGANRIFALRESNMYIGTDMEHEEEKFEIFFAKEADEIRYVNEFKYGTQIALPNEIVKYTNS